MFWKRCIIYHQLYSYALILLVYHIKKITAQSIRKCEKVYKPHNKQNVCVLLNRTYHFQQLHCKFSILFNCSSGRQIKHAATQTRWFSCCKATRMWRALTEFYSKMLQVKHDQSRDHILPPGATNWGRAAVMWSVPDPGVEAIKSSYVSHPQQTVVGVYHIFA